MSEYTTREPRLQAYKFTDSTGKSEEFYVDTDTGERIEKLQDEKFPWRQRKKLTLGLADAYKEGQLDSYADRALSCSTWLEYLVKADRSVKQLHHFNACKLRLCPLCAARRAKIMANRLTKIIKKVQADHSGTQLIFLTLTMENVPGDKLREALDQLTKAWYRLCHRRPFDRAVKGWFRAIEITRNRVQDTYHPHIHAILVVEDAYFSRANKLYLTHDRWVEMWQQSLRVDYRPIVGIQRTRGKDSKATGKAAQAEAAALEAAKYATKDAEYINRSLSQAEAAEVTRVYTEALTRKRMTAFGGWMLEASQALALDVEDDSDLVHDDDGNGELTEETAELLESYGWHFGVQDHILVRQEANPGYAGAGEKKDEGEG